MTRPPGSGVRLVERGEVRVRGLAARILIAGCPQAGRCWVTREDTVDCEISVSVRSLPRSARATIAVLCGVGRVAARTLVGRRRCDGMHSRELAVGRCRTRDSRGTESPSEGAVSALRLLLGRSARHVPYRGRVARPPNRDNRPAVAKCVGKRGDGDLWFQGRTGGRHCYLRQARARRGVPGRRDSTLRTGRPVEVRTGGSVQARGVIY